DERCCPVTKRTRSGFEGTSAKLAGSRAAVCDRLWSTRRRESEGLYVLGLPSASRRLCIGPLRSFTIWLGKDTSARALAAHLSPEILERAGFTRSARSRQP